MFGLIDGVESDLEDDIDELMSNSGTEFVFKNEDSEQNDALDYQPKNNHVIEDEGENLVDSEEESQEGRFDVPEAKGKPKGQLKNRKEKERSKERENSRLRRLKFC